MTLLEQLAAGIGQRYRIERELGQGGMAVVFLAQDCKYDRLVAVKLLKPEWSAMLGGERFLREIALAAPLQHPHIVPLYDSGDAAGLLFYVMPFVEGESLRQRLGREQQLPIEAALQIIREVGSALQYAHDHGVVHRDVKPDNILLTGGHAVVADFGIARALHAAGPAQLTLTGMAVGTPQYMSPEQASGSQVDGRSDQYSLACVLYESLIGQPPFAGPSVQALIARHSLDPVPSLRSVRPTIPTGVESAIVKAMAKIPADRFDSVRDFLDALGTRTSASAVMTVVPERPGPRLALPPRRALAAGLALGAIVLAMWWTFGRGKATDAPLPRAVPAGVAVLPFQEIGGKPDSSYLADGVTQGLIADLAQIGSLKVISQSSGAQAEGERRSLGELARELGVSVVARGEVRRSGDTVSIDVRVLQAPDSAVLLAQNYRARLGELPELQRTMTLGIAQAIGADVNPAERHRLDAREEVDQRAYDAYLHGRFELDRGELERARLQFEQASRAAPDWAPPYVGLASYYTSLPFVADVSPADVLPKARGALQHALQLDETSAEAHAANAYIRAYYDWDWRGAEQEFRRALELRPSSADAYFSYSRFLASRRRLDEAIAQLSRAVELDPLSRLLQANRALLDYFAGRYADAADRLQTLLQSDSTDQMAQWGLALVAEQQGNPARAVALLEPISGRNLNRKSSLGHAYAVAGQEAKARAVLAALGAEAAKRYVPAYDFALVHAGLDDRDEAFRYLQRAYDERSTVLAYLLIDPRLALLRDDPRFAALAARLAGE